MDYEAEVRGTFPQLDEIEDDELRNAVVDLWATGLEDSDFDSIEDVPWSTNSPDALGDQRQVPHVRDVVSLAIALADRLVERREVEVDRDLVVAGAFLHDVSKLYEYFSGERSDIGHLVEHPHYGVHLTAGAGLPVELQHIVVSHTSNSAVEPKTIEAVLVRTADHVAVEGMFCEATGLVRTLAEAGE